MAALDENTPPIDPQKRETQAAATNHIPSLIMVSLSLDWMWSIREAIIKGIMHSMITSPVKNKGAI